MNSNSTSISSATSGDAISRRAYEIWEREGRPEGDDLRHWLQAEKELGGNSDGMDSSSDSSQPFGQSGMTTPRSTDTVKSTDTRPLQGTRAGSAKKSSNGTTTSPFGERAAPSGGQGAGAKRR